MLRETDEESNILNNDHMDNLQDKKHVFYALQTRIAELHAAAAAAMARSFTPGDGADGGTSPRYDQGGGMMLVI